MLLPLPRERPQQVGRGAGQIPLGVRRLLRAERAAGAPSRVRLRPGVGAAPQEPRADRDAERNAATHATAVPYQGRAEEPDRVRDHARSVPAEASGRSAGSGGDADRRPQRLHRRDQVFHFQHGGWSSRARRDLRTTSDGTTSPGGVTPGKPTGPRGRQV